MRAVAVVFLALLAAGCGGAGAVATSTRNAPTRSAVAAADPYKASLAYAACMRQHGVPHPDPNRKGDFELTPAQERRLRAVPAKARHAAQRACFHTLKGLDLRPLTAQAKRRALVVLKELSRCMRRRGYVFGKPVVRNLSLGRAFFGFETSPRLPPNLHPGSAQVERDERACEKRVDMARRISAIIDADRSPG